MKQIAPLPLWLGHAGDGRDYRRIFDAGIAAVVQLALEEPPLQPPRELLYLRFPLLDGPGNSRSLLSLAINTVSSLIQYHMPTLICCSAGMSRSPLIAAAAIAVGQQVRLEASLAQVTQHGPCDISPGLLHEIAELLGPQYGV